MRAATLGISGDDGGRCRLTLASLEGERVVFPLLLGCTLVPHSSRLLQRGWEGGGLCSLLFVSMKFG